MIFRLAAGAMVGMGSVVDAQRARFSSGARQPSPQRGRGLQNAGPMLMKFEAEFDGEVTCKHCGAQYRIKGQFCFRNVASASRRFFLNPSARRRCYYAEQPQIIRGSWWRCAGHDAGASPGRSGPSRHDFLKLQLKLGGLASAWNLNGISSDRHYHVTLLSDSHLRDLLGTLKLDDEMKMGRDAHRFFIWAASSIRCRTQ